ncbi:MAG: DegT/DnrJ/EryC1/StrS aminotransferase [Eubacteriales bacterium]|nr:DegT/DnrJ/EryC1/StrS aminotransferase [Eubacteriales bacterium]
MKKIGGYFPYEKLSQEPNHYLENLTPSGGELKYLMSGRCAIYYSLMDFKPDDAIRTAYVPIYTCETVLAPFEKAGYELIFYDLDENMTPVFDPSVLDKISVLSLCGYYGFSAYDRDFVSACSRRGICIIEDATHSIFSADGIDRRCDYIVGSFRKWIGVACGGFAIKAKGKFSAPLLPPLEEHIRQREECLSLKNHFEKLSPLEQERVLQQGDALFWKSEMQLRQIFDSYGADEASIKIMEYYPVSKLQEKRRANYQYLLEHLKPSSAWRLVFPSLPDGVVPSHLTLFARNRDMLKEILSHAGIGCTVYWPVGPLVNLENHPTAQYIYDHVCSIPCDQRYGDQEMQEICDVLNSLL